MLTAAISYSQATTCSQFSIQDTTDYSYESPSNISSRTVTLYKADGTIYRQPGQTADAIDWPYADGNTLSVLGLTEDLALNAVMILVPISADPNSTYSVALLLALTCFLDTELFDRAKRQSEDKRYERNVIFTNDTHRIIIEKTSAQNAIAQENINGAQLALTRAKNIADLNQKPY